MPRPHLRLHPADNGGAALADLVVVATPWEGTLTTVSALEEHGRQDRDLDGQCPDPMGPDMVPLLPPRVGDGLRGPRPAQIAGRRRLSPSAGRPLGRPRPPLDADVMVCSDDRAASGEVVGADRPVARSERRGLRSLSSALAIEALTPLA